VTLKWDCDAAACASTTVLATPPADSTGAFSIGVTVPSPSPYGRYYVGAIDSGGGFAPTQLKVVPSLTISPIKGAQGSSATVTGDGFAPDDTVTLLWNCAPGACASPTTLGHPDADGNGHLSAPVTIPSGDTVGAYYKIAGEGDTTPIFGYTSFKLTS
jgi:hypothetical protein